MTILIIVVFPRCLLRTRPTKLGSGKEKNGKPEASQSSRNGIRGPRAAPTRDAQQVLRDFAQSALLNLIAGPSSIGTCISQERVPIFFGHIDGPT